MREEVTGVARDFFSKDVASQVTFGKRYEDLPEPFRKDRQLVGATLDRVYSPQNLKKGLKHIEAFGDLFDMVKK